MLADTQQTHKHTEMCTHCHTHFPYLTDTQANAKQTGLWKGHLQQLLLEGRARQNQFPLSQQKICTLCRLPSPRCRCAAGCQHLFVLRFHCFHCDTCTPEHAEGQRSLTPTHREDKTLMACVRVCARATATVYVCVCADVCLCARVCKGLKVWPHAAPAQLICRQHSRAPAKPCH